MTRISSILLLASLAVAAPAGAQNTPVVIARGLKPTPLGKVVISDDNNAWQTREQLRQLMQQYPPSLGQVISIDPTLGTNQAYLEPYPNLAAFLAQHPEVAHNPRYFFGEFRERNDFNESYTPRMAALRTIQDALAGLAVLIGLLSVVGTIAWLLRSVMEHRKWQKASKTHAETHTRLMERLTSNEDLLAYTQSPAGRRFLEAAPIPLASGPRTLAAPFGRILWSVQAGLVVAFLGGGLIYASHQVAANPTFADGELPLFVIGVAMMAIGAGFFVSSMAAYALSHRLGLFRQAANGSADPGAGSGNGHAS